MFPSVTNCKVPHVHTTLENHIYDIQVNFDINRILNINLKTLFLEMHVKNLANDYHLPRVNI